MRADDDGAAPSLDDFWIMIKGWREARNGAVSFLELLHLNVRFQTTCAEGLVGPYSSTNPGWAWKYVLNNHVEIIQEFSVVQRQP